MKTGQPWVGRCRVMFQPTPEQPSQNHILHAAVWCDSRDTFESTLRTHLLVENATLETMEEAMPATQWLSRFGHDRILVSLAAGVRRNAPVAFGAPVPLPVTIPVPIPASMPTRKPAFTPDETAQGPCEGPLPRLRPASDADPEAAPTLGSGLVIPLAQRREMARQWHLDNPETFLSILQKSQILKDPSDGALALARHYMAEATQIGFHSLQDLVQYTGACLHAGGSLATEPSFRAFLKDVTDDCPDVMQRFLDHTPITYWTYLPEKVKKHEPV